MHRIGTTAARGLLMVALVGALGFASASAARADDLEGLFEAVGAGAPEVAEAITLELDEFDRLEMTRPTGKIKKTGQSEVPGTGGRKVDWKITVKKNGKKSMQVWIDVKSSDGRAIKFVICAMVNIKNHGNTKHDVYLIQPDGHGGYKCVKDGCRDMPPSFHLGCKTVSLSGGGNRNVFDRRVDLTTEFGAEDIESLYFDILSYGGLPSGGGCGGVVGPNKFLIPDDPAGDRDNWANIWGGGGGRTTLSTVAAVGFQANYVASVPVGNWVTMGYPANYPALMEATVEGAPTGSLVRVVTNGVAGPLYKVDAGADGGCTGLPLEIKEPFVITPEGGSNEIFIGFPQEECGKVAEGHSTRVWGNIYSEEAGEIYPLDAFMYGLSYEFFHDTVPPEILSVTGSVGADGLRIDVSARDASTMPDGATFVWTTADGEEGEAPLNFATPAMVGDVAYFSDLVPGFPVGEAVDCEVVVYDEGGNETRRPVAKAVVAGPADGRPPGEREGEPRDHGAGDRP